MRSWTGGDSVQSTRTNAGDFRTGRRKAKSMKVQLRTRPLDRFYCVLQRASIGIVLVAVLAAAPAALAAIPWDGEGTDGIWFNPLNWNRNMNDNITLPPGSPTDTDTE